MMVEVMQGHFLNHWQESLCEYMLLQYYLASNLQDLPDV